MFVCVLCMCMCTCECELAHKTQDTYMWKPKNNVLIPCFHHVGPEDKTYVICLGSRSLYLLCHLT